MRLPATAISGHLLWTREGTAWAVYSVRAAANAYLSSRDKLSLHSRLRAAIAMLPEESMLLGITRQVGEDQLLQRMRTGGYPSVSADFDQDIREYAREFAAAAVHERRFYLAVRLPDAGLSSGRGLSSAMRHAIFEAFGVGPACPTVREQTFRARQSDVLQAQLSTHVEITPVSTDELRWLYARAPLRGLAEPSPDEIPQTALARAAELTVLNDATYYEGGRAEDPDRPGHRRYLRVDSLRGTSYQALLAVCDMPREFVFPGGSSEWFRALDELPFPVDWCARITSVDNARAQLAARRQARQLAGQFEQHDGDTAGAPRALADAVHGVDDEQAELAASHEPELRAAFILCIGQPDLRSLEEAAAQLQAYWAGAEYGLARPTGGQAALFRAMLPGSPLPQVGRDYLQYLLPRDLAAGMPFASCEVGDDTGMPLGLSLDTGSVKPVLFDPTLGPRTSRSGSVGVAGNLGSGKSYFIKRVAYETLARGGRVVALDRTERGEYVAFAQVAPGTAQVITLHQGSPVCADPMRLFHGTERVAYTTGFLSLLTQTPPADPAGVALTEAVHVAASTPSGTIHSVIEQLEQLGSHDVEAERLARKIRALARSPHGAVVFDGQERAPMRLDADYLVLHLPSLALPSREQLQTPGLATQMLPEQLFSQAMVYLSAAIIRSVTFSDWDRFAAALLDEAWALTASLQGQQLILDFIRDGRKHNAAVWLISQHADDLGDGQIANLLGSRFIFRQEAGAAPSACRFLGVEETPAVQDFLQTATSGQCLYRDLRGRIGAVQVLAAPSRLHDALNTTPEQEPRATTPTLQRRPRGRGARRVPTSGRRTSEAQRRAPTQGAPTPGEGSAAADALPDTVTAATSHCPPADGQHPASERAIDRPSGTPRSQEAEPDGDQQRTQDTRQPHVSPTGAGDDVADDASPSPHGATVQELPTEPTDDDVTPVTARPAGDERPTALVSDEGHEQAEQADEVDQDPSDPRDPQIEGLPDQAPDDGLVLPEPPRHDREDKEPPLDDVILPDPPAEPFDDPPPGSAWLA